MEHKKKWMPGPKVQDRYGRTKMTIRRWGQDVELDFPKPIKINNRNYWDEAELDRWDATRERGGAA